MSSGTLLKIKLSVVTVVMTAAMTGGAWAWAAVAVTPAPAATTQPVPAPARVRAPVPARASAPAPAPTAAVVVAPMHSEGSRIRYPRLTAFPNAAVRARVNAIFAAREKQAHEDRAGCFDLIRDAGRRPSDANFSVTIDVRYVSLRFISMDIRRSYDCAGPYPNDGIPEPLTLDLRTGSEIDWNRIFKPGVLPDDSGAERTPRLLALYKARYAESGGKAHPECRRVVDENLGNVFLWIETAPQVLARSGNPTTTAPRDPRTRLPWGLVVVPDFPHALQACADEIVLPKFQFGDLVADPEFLTDVKATMPQELSP